MKKYFSLLLLTVFALTAATPANADEYDVDSYPTVEATAENNGAGSWVKSGDVNGDGIDDIITAGYNFIYVILGGNIQFGANLGASSDVVFNVLPAANSISDLSVGDLDDDGMTDILVSYRNSSTQDQTVAVIYGKSNYVFTDTAITSAAKSIFTDSNDTYLLHRARVGDLDGDGHSDLVIGQSVDIIGNDKTGQVSVLYGDGNRPSKNMNLDDSDAYILGLDDGFSEDQKFAGELVIGDFNGDDIDDIGVADTQFEVNNGEYNGRVDVVLGGADRLSGSLMIDEISHATVFGETSDDYIGSDLAVADVDGNGKDDLLFGSRANTYSGDPALITLYGDKITEGIGTVASNLHSRYITDYNGGRPTQITVGRLNGDNIDDIIIGGDSSTKDGLPRQHSLIYFGRNTDWRKVGEKGFRQFDADTIAGTDNRRTAVSAIGDFDNNGVSDIVYQHPTPTGGITLVTFTSTDGPKMYGPANGGRIFEKDILGNKNTYKLFRGNGKPQVISLGKYVVALSPRNKVLKVFNTETKRVVSTVRLRKNPSAKAALQSLKFRPYHNIIPKTNIIVTAEKGADTQLSLLNLNLDTGKLTLKSKKKYAVSADVYNTTFQVINVNVRPEISLNDSVTTLQISNVLAAVGVRKKLRQQALN